MTILKPNWRWLAIPASLVFVCGGLRLILGPSLMSPSTWTDYHIIALLIVAGTIGAGHLCGVAWRDSRYLALAGFCLLFAMGTLLVVRQSLNRQAETHGQTMLAAEDINTRIAQRYSELAAARDRLAYAESQFEKEQTGQRCAERCRRWEKTASDRRIVVRAIEAEIAALGPQKPVEAGAEYLAKLAGFFGYQREKTITLDTLFTPLITALFFELGSVISLGAAFRHSRATVKSPLTVVKPDLTTDLSDTSGQTDYPALTASDVSNVVAFVRPSDEPDPTPPKRPRRWRRDEVFEDLTGKLGRGERFESQRQMAMKYGVPTSTLSDWFGQWMKEGAQIQRTQIGRRNMVMAG